MWIRASYSLFFNYLIQSVFKIKEGLGYADKFLPHTLSYLIPYLFFQKSSQHTLSVKYWFLSSNSFWKARAFPTGEYHKNNPFHFVSSYLHLFIWFLPSNASSQLWLQLHFPNLHLFLFQSPTVTLSTHKSQEICCIVSPVFRCFYAFRFISVVTTTFFFSFLTRHNDKYCNVTYFPRVI